VAPPQPRAAGGVRGAMMDCSSVEEDGDTGRSVGHTFALSRDGSRDRVVRNLINPTCCVPEAQVHKSVSHRNIGTEVVKYKEFQTPKLHSCMFVEKRSKISRQVSVDA
jgi:hypothetical protein